MMDKRCSHFGVCGGCSLQHLSMEQQVAHKQERLFGLLRGQGGVEARRILPPIEGPAWGYRHRARLAVKHVPKKGGALVGFRERDRRYVADMDRCEILPVRISALIGPLRGLINGLSVRDRIPQIELAVGERAASMVVRTLDSLSDEDVLALRRFGRENGIAFFLQPGGVDTITPLVPEEVGELTYSLPAWGLSIAFGPADFIQVNPYVNRSLVQGVVDMLDPRAEECIADLFCGVGNFTLPLARCGARVTGFEAVPAQVEQARRNAQSNGLGGMADFVVRDLYDGSTADATFLECFDKALLDPPRSGAEEVVGAMGHRGPRRIVYVSCNPQTLARDAAVLVKKKGFALEACGVVDMFPHTLHVEALALFERER